METATTKITPEPSSEYVQMYYAHQYERVAKLEEQRLTITNIVITFSVVAFTFGFSNPANLTILNGIGLPLILILTNLFAIGYIHRCHDFIRAHKDRARAILERYAPALAQINNEFKWAKETRWGGREEFQSRIHQLLIVASMIPILAFIAQVAHIF